MKTHLLLPVVCLLVGGAAGYGLRPMIGGHESSPASPSGSLSSGKSSVTSKAKFESRGTSPDASSVGQTLGDQMKELLTDFDVKSAQKAASKLSVDELQKALALVAAMPKNLEREHLRAQLYHAWALLEPNAAWKAALADPLDKTKGTMAGAVAGAVAKKNPAAAIELALSLGMGGKRTTVLGKVFEEWSKVDVAAAIAYSTAHPDLPVDTFSFTRGLTLLAEKDPMKAANLVIEFKDEMRRNGMLTTMMAGWVERDPTAALKWAQALSNPKLRLDATASVVGAWAKEDPAAALAYVQGIKDNETRISSFKKAWTDWFKNSPKEAAAYLANTKNEDLMQSVRFELSYYSESLTSQERIALLTNLPEGKLKEDVFRSITDSRIRKGQFNEALEMLNDMPDSRERDRSVAKLGQEWAKADLDAAAAWLKLQPDSSDRDLATAGYAGVLARTNPRSAIQWAEAIPDVKVRKDALMNVAVGWHRGDPDKAAAWIASASAFTDSDRKIIQLHVTINSDNIMIPITVGKRR